MNNIRPGQGYEQRNEQQFRDEVAREIAKLVVRGLDIELGQGRLIIPSPDGQRWSLTASNVGVLTLTLVP